MRDRLIELPIDDAILILKEEHKQRVDGYTTHLSYGGKGDPAEEVSLDALEMAISALEQTKWISVKDRLPELIPCNAGTAYSEAVIVWTDNRKAMIAVWDGIDFLCAARYWEAEGEEITHWMPLPQPPKGE